MEVYYSVAGGSTGLTRDGWLDVVGTFDSFLIVFHAL